MKNYLSLAARMGFAFAAVAMTMLEFGVFVVLPARAEENTQGGAVVIASQDTASLCVNTSTKSQRAQ